LSLCPCQPGKRQGETQKKNNWQRDEASGKGAASLLGSKRGETILGGGTTSQGKEVNSLMLFSRLNENKSSQEQATKGGACPEKRTSGHGLAVFLYWQTGKKPEGTKKKRR